MWLLLRSVCPLVSATLSDQNHDSTLTYPYPFPFYSGILFTVSGALGTWANTLAAGLAEIATITAPASLLISELQFTQTLYNDQNANYDLLTSDDILGKFQSLIGKSVLGGAGAKSTIAAYISQLSSAKNLLSAAAKRFSN